MTTRKKNKRFNSIENSPGIYQRLERKKLNRKGATKALYPRYMVSPAWYARRKLYFTSHAHRCAVCARTTEITLHHMSYLHLGNERDEELIPLCRGHHEEYHELHGTQHKMTSKTHAYIESKKKEILSRKTPKEEALGTLQAHNPS